MSVNTSKVSHQRKKRAALLVSGTLAVILIGGIVFSQTSGHTDAVGRLGGDYHALRVLPDGRLLYGEHQGVSVSEDGGRSWSAPSGIGDAMSLSSSPQAPDRLVMAGHDVFKVSEDGGTTWREVSFGNLPGTDLHGFAVAPSNPEVWYANIAGRGLYRTENAKDWEFLSPGTASAMALAVGPGKYPRIYALTMNEGLIVSDNGTSWLRASDAPRGAGSGLDVHPVSGNVYLAGPDGVARSEDKGASWQDLNFPEGARLVTTDPQDERKVFAVGESGKVYRSTDAGATWNR